MNECLFKLFFFLFINSFLNIFEISFRISIRIHTYINKRKIIFFYLYLYCNKKKIEWLSRWAALQICFSQHNLSLTLDTVHHLKIMIQLLFHLLFLAIMDNWIHSWNCIIIISFTFFVVAILLLCTVLSMYRLL